MNGVAVPLEAPKLNDEAGGVKEDGRCGSGAGGRGCSVLFAENHNSAAVKVAPKLKDGVFGDAREELGCVSGAIDAKETCRVVFVMGSSMEKVDRRVLAGALVDLGANAGEGDGELFVWVIVSAGR